MSVSRAGALDALRTEIEKLSAAEAADLLLSPFVAPNLLNEITREPGPAMWIVNRSDVYDDTLEALTAHALPEIAQRARDKLNQRRSTLTHWAPPADIEGPLETQPEFAVEEILGHPLAPFDAILHYAKNGTEDQRASAALSATRRLVEVPPRWLSTDPDRIHLTAVFERQLMSDDSPYVRAYAARVPLVAADALTAALPLETNPFVFGRLLQNPAFPADALLPALTALESRESLRSEFPWRVLAADRRLSPFDRSRLATRLANDPLARALNDWYCAGA